MYLFLINVEVGFSSRRVLFPTDLQKLFDSEWMSSSKDKTIEITAFFVLRSVQCSVPDLKELYVDSNPQRLGAYRRTADSKSFLLEC